MIFVTVGTTESPFDRLLEAVDRLHLDEELVVQYGASPVRPAGALCLESLPLPELAAYVARARVVVTHAGVGTILTALANGTRPVVVPRLRRYREAVDDHQLELARRLPPETITLVEDLAGLPAALALPAERETMAIVPDPRLIDDLRVVLGARHEPSPAPVVVPAQPL